MQLAFASVECRPPASALGIDFLERQAFEAVEFRWWGPVGIGFGPGVAARRAAVTEVRRFACESASRAADEREEAAA